MLGLELNNDLLTGSSNGKNNLSTVVTKRPDELKVAINASSDEEILKRIEILLRKIPLVSSEKDKVVECAKRQVKQIRSKKQKNSLGGLVTQGKSGTGLGL